MTHLIAGLVGFLFGIFLTTLCYMARETDDCQQPQSYRRFMDLNPNPHPPNCPECGKFMKRIFKDGTLTDLWTCTHTKSTVQK